MVLDIVKCWFLYLLATRLQLISFKNRRSIYYSQISASHRFIIEMTKNHFTLASELRWVKCLRLTWHPGGLLRKLQKECKGVVLFSLGQVQARISWLCRSLLCGFLCAFFQQKQTLIHVIRYDIGVFRRSKAICPLNLELDTCRVCSIRVKVRNLLFNWEDLRWLSD